jgi:uncharacterized protein (DUF2237 family)
MLRDDSADRGGRRHTARNVLGEPLEICSIKPTTGFYRDGCSTLGERTLAVIRFVR